MGYDERKGLYKKIEEIRRRPLIAYVTSVRPGAGCQIAADAIPSIIEQIQAAPAENRVDFLVISNGGDLVTATRIIGLLREKFNTISVLTPYTAYSAATIIALGADEIVMHPYSNLGPVDPQMSVNKKNGNQNQRMEFGAEDIRNYVEFMKEDAGLSGNEMASVLVPLVNEIGAIPIGAAKRGRQLSLSASKKMLGSHMERRRAEEIAERLNTSYYHHGYAIGRKEAQELGLAVSAPDDRTKHLMWEVWQDFSKEMLCAEPFNPLAAVMEDRKASAFLRNPQPQATQPAIPGIPAQGGRLPVQQGIVHSQETIKTKTLAAAVESLRHGSSIYQNTNIMYWRNPDMSPGFNVTSYPGVWEQNTMSDKNKPKLIRNRPDA